MNTEVFPRKVLNQLRLSIWLGLSRVSFVGSLFCWSIYVSSVTKENELNKIK